MSPRKEQEAAPKRRKASRKGGGAPKGGRAAAAKKKAAARTDGPVASPDDAVVPSPSAPGAVPTPVEPEAPSVEDAPLTVPFDQIVVFYLDGQRYALPIDRVQEIQQIVALKEVPDPASAVLGMIDLRGAVVPVIDLRALLGLPREELGLDTPMVICEAGGQLLALVVDEVQDVVALPAGCLRRPSSIHSLADRMIGVCRMDDDLVFLLDIDALFPRDAMRGALGGGAS